MEGKKLSFLRGSHPSIVVRTPSRTHTLACKPPTRLLQHIPTAQWMLTRTLACRAPLSVKRRMAAGISGVRLLTKRFCIILSNSGHLFTPKRVSAGAGEPVHGA